MVPRRLWLVLLAAVVASACTRSRPADFPPPDDLSPDGTEAVAPATAASITVEQPAVAAEVSSPITVEGYVDLGPDRALAVQVQSVDADGGLRWRGNGPLDVDAEGRFSGSVDYALDGDADGVVEVIIIDPALGTVLESKPVEVRLRATR